MTCGLPCSGLKRSCTGWFCSILFAISMPMCGSYVVAPMAMKPAVAASSSACVGFTSVPSKSMSKALALILFCGCIVVPACFCLGIVGFL